VQLLKNLEHTYVRCTSGAAAGQYEADARTVRWGRNGVCRALCVGNAPTREPQTCENITEDPETGPDRPW
jgi:hypothetical protein